MRLRLQFSAKTKFLEARIMSAVMLWDSTGFKIYKSSLGRPEAAAGSVPGSPSPT